MRAWRPEIFSDSKQENVQKLSKAVFEYHLETLTSRKQEYEFEHFCRKLCEKELCPNLRVQTGPTGGGDSKVDAETYPVASTIAERWWMGSPSAGAERWAFAFSAKQDWKSKVKADVENIISTGRSYALIYFLPIRLTQTPTTCWVRPIAGVEFSVGRRLSPARDPQQ